MFYKDWKPIYEKIAKDFNFKLEKEKKSAVFLDKLLERKDILSLERIEKIINNEEIVVFGAGPSIDKSIVLNRNKIENCVKISADGATSALIKNGILPDIIVTDLDGYVPDQIDANSNGSAVIIHAHGDNISELKKYLLDFNKKILGSTQIDPQSFKNVYNFGGFTDGDRGVFLSNHFNAKKIFLIGFNFSGKIGKYSFLENKDKIQKLKKLDWCKKLIELLIKNNENIYIL